jgi:hypothetical protein
MGSPGENGYHSVPTAGLARGCATADWLTVRKRPDRAKREIYPLIYCVFIYLFIYSFSYLVT